jgi:hypothetical protein
VTARAARHAAPLLLLALSLTVAPAVLAKGGMQARLDAPIPGNAAPGTMLSVGWTTMQAVEGTMTIASSGAPVFIALTEPGADAPSALVFGTEDPAGSGHYTADIAVPPGGIAADGVTIGLRGESCAAGVCERSDLLFVIVGPVRAAAVAPPPRPAVATPPEVAGVGEPPATMDIVLLVGMAAIALVAVGSAVRRRGIGRLATD